MKKVLITGGSGFIGYHIVRRLCQNNVAVRCLIRQSSSRNLLKNFDVEYHIGDLNDAATLRNACDGCDTVFHTAGLVRAKNYQEFERVNRFGTENLARIAVQSPTPPVFVSISSLSAAGSSLLNQPRRETDIPAPISLYGKSKLAGEDALRPFADKMPCTIIRPGIVFGEADKMNLPLFKVIKKWGFYPHSGYGDKFYSWIHADDLAGLLLSIAQNGERLAAKPGDTIDRADGLGIYFAASDEGYAWSEMCQLIGKAMGRHKVRAVYCGPIAMGVLSTFYEIAKRCSGNPQPLDWEKARESRFHWTCSPEKIKSQFNFTPEPLEERIQQVSQWFIDNAWV